MVNASGVPAQSSCCFNDLGRRAIRCVDIVCTHIGHCMYMRLLGETERDRADGVARVGYCNPFLPERVACERDALGPEFVERAAVWSVQADGGAVHPNVGRLAHAAEELAAAMRARLVAGARATDEERQLYEDIVLYAIYSRYENTFYALIALGTASGRVDFYEAF